MLSRCLRSQEKKSVALDDIIGNGNINDMLIRVQLDPNEPEEMCDEATLLQWAKDGKLLGQHRVWVSAQQKWVFAKEHPRLSRFFTSSIWDAWEVEDEWELDSDIETGIRRRMKASKEVEEATQPKPKPPPKTLPLSAITPLEDSPVKKTVLPSDAQVQKEFSKLNAVGKASAPVLSPPPRTLLSNKQSASTVEANKALSTLWNKDLPLQDQPQLWLREEKKSSNFSFFRVALLVIPVLLVFLIVRWYIVSEAAAVFPLEAEVESSSASSKKIDVFGTLEQEIRSSLRSDVQVVSPSSSLSDALRIDLEYAKLDIEYIEAQVLSWKGRFLDEPKSARIRIAIRSEGEADKEIALVGMIVAKYTEQYLLEMEKFTVVFAFEDGNFQRDVLVSDARTLFLHPGSLEGFLETVMQ